MNWTQDSAPRSKSILQNAGTALRSCREPATLFVFTETKGPWRRREDFMTDYTGG
jgi:hypothetical protein